MLFFVFLPVLFWFGWHGLTWLLRQIYYHGPYLNGYGFWQSMTKPTMCTIMSQGNPTAEFFAAADPSGVCERLIASKETAFLLMARTVIVGLLLWYLLQVLLSHWMWQRRLRPIEQLLGAVPVKSFPVFRDVAREDIEQEEPAAKTLDR